MGRSEEAQEIIASAQRWSFAAGFLPLPWVDAAAVTYVQVEMIKQLCALYGVSYRESSAKGLVTALVGALVPTALGTSVARVALRHLPGIGQVVATLSLPTSLGGSTAVIGKLVAQHLGGGGTLADFDLSVREPATTSPAVECEPRAPAVEGSRAPAADDLTAIKGVGPRIAELLRGAGICTFEQVAATSAEELRGILVGAGSGYRSHDPSTWPSQAASL